MDIYYFIFIISFLLCFFDFIPYKGLRFLAYFLSCGILIFIVGLRKVGIDNDSEMYEEMFYFYSKASFSDLFKGGWGYVEPGFTSLNKIIGNSGFNFRIFLVIIAVLTGILNYLFFYKKTKFPFISLLTYLSFFLLYRDFTQIRYALCCAICFWCVSTFINKRYYSSVFLFLIAISMHNAAFILIPVLPFIKFFRKNLILILLPFPCLIVGYSINLFPFLLKSGLANEHMELYMKEDGGAGLALSFIGYLIVLIYFLLENFSKKVNFTDEQNFYFRIVALSVSLNFLFIQSAIFQRFTYILFQFCVILISVILQSIKIFTKRKESFFILYMFLAAFLLFYGIKMIDPTLIRPYEISFEK